MRRSPVRVWITFGLGAAVAVGLLAHVGPGRILAAVTTASPDRVLAALAAYVAFFVLRGLRWKLLLRNAAPDATLPLAASLTAGGWLVSTFIPFKAGDVTRAALMAHRTRSSLFGVAGTVAVERLLDLVGLAATASAALIYLAFGEHTYLPASVAEGVAIAWVLPPAALLALLLLARIASWQESDGRAIRFVRRFLDAADELWRSPRQIPALAVATLLVSASQVAVFFFLIQSLAPEIPQILVLTAVPLFLLSFAIAITPGHVGTYEAAFVAIFALLGLDPQNLLATAVALHILGAGLVVVLGSTGFVLFRATAEPPVQRDVPAYVEARP